LSMFLRCFASLNAPPLFFFIFSFSFPDFISLLCKTLM
jgi:hypothetical protein